MPHTTTRTPPARRRGRAASLALAAAGAALAACGKDPLEAASANNIDTIPVNSLVVYPLSTAAAPLNTAISVGGLSPVRPAVSTVAVGSNLLLVPNFDFAVDRAPDGRVRLLPSKLVAGLEGTGRALRTGIQAVTTPFDSLDAAPGGTYQRDSATVVGERQTFVVETEPVTCLSSSRTFIYAKFVVDSISPTTGGIHMRARIDPNCGYRSLRPGKPTS